MSSTRRVAKWFDGRLGVGARERLWRDLRCHEPLRREYNRRLELEAMLRGVAAPRALSALEMERLEDFVVQPRRSGTVKTWLGIPRAAVAAVGALLVLVSFAFLRLLGPTGSPSDMDFAPRGSAAPYETHLFLFCVTGEGEQARFHRLDRPSADHRADSCDIDGELQFALTNVADTYRYMSVFGVDEAGRRLWYFPRPGEAQSVAVPTGVREMVWGESIVLKINHRPGTARVFAVFSSEPISKQTVEAALATGDVDSTGRYTESFEMRIIDQGDAP